MLDFTTALLAVAIAPAAHDSVPLYPDLGDHHHAISTKVSLTQRYFDQGLRLSYGFNHAEAIRSFREAARLDPSCGMCWWGVAFAYGPNINSAMDSASGAAAWDAVRRALALRDQATAAERGWIDAIAKRYAADPMAPRPPLDSAYARAMGMVAKANPDDDDAAVLYADAQMNLSPWDYWVDNRDAKPNAKLALAALDRVLARSPDHAGACHFFIHAVEEAYPERAVPCAEKLPGLMPGAGHIVHMPAHIYIRVGRYADAIDRNIHATHADEMHIGDMAPDGAYRLAYYPHNYHFLWFAATLAGRGDQAIEAARRTAEKTDRELMRAPGLRALQLYLSTPLFALVRFQRWDEILAEAPPPEDLAFPMAMWHYARASTFAAKNRLPEAEQELAAMKVERGKPGIEGEKIWDATPVSAVIDIAIESVAGDIAARKRDWKSAIAHLERARGMEDALTYTEPPDWHYPVREQLGNVLLDAGMAKKAEDAFRQDLVRFPENGWALDGLERSLRAQGRTAEADAVHARLRKAFATADVKLRGR